MRGENYAYSACLKDHCAPTGFDISGNIQNDKPAYRVYVPIRANGVSGPYS